jgi:hypothetical protein
MDRYLTAKKWVVLNSYRIQPAKSLPCEECFLEHQAIDENHCEDCEELTQTAACARCDRCSRESLGYCTCADNEYDCDCDRDCECYSYDIYIDCDLHSSGMCGECYENKQCYGIYPYIRMIYELISNDDLRSDDIIFDAELVRKKLIKLHSKRKYHANDKQFCSHTKCGGVHPRYDKHRAITKKIKEIAI